MDNSFPSTIATYSISIHIPQYMYSYAFFSLPLSYIAYLPYIVFQYSPDANDQIFVVLFNRISLCACVCALFLYAFC